MTKGEKLLMIRLSGEVKLGIIEFIEYEKKRGDCYRLLSACFYPPKKELFLDEDTIGSLTSALKEGFPEAAASSERMELAILEHSNEDLSVEYARLFLGPFELKAPPYGSIYLDKGKIVMGDSTVEVLKLYQEAGLLMDVDFRDMPDHITAELEFMYYLIYKEAEALGKSDMDAAEDMLRRQKAFFEKFLSPFALQFCAKLKEGAGDSFYMALSKCLDAFIAHDDINERLRDITVMKQCEVET